MHGGVYRKRRCDTHTSRETQDIRAHDVVSPKFWRSLKISVDNPAASLPHGLVRIYPRKRAFKTRILMKIKITSCSVLYSDSYDIVRSRGNICTKKGYKLKTYPKTGRQRLSARLRPDRTLPRRRWLPAALWLPRNVRHATADTR